MSSDFSKNRDGKERAPSNRISSHLDGQQPAHPNDHHEQQIIEALKGRYDDIEALWNQAEDDLRRFRISQAVHHYYDSEEGGGTVYSYCLAFSRYGKEWRICHGVSDERYPEGWDEWKPITECRLDLREKMIGEFENLRKKVVEAAEQTVPKLDEAIARFRKILKS